MYAGSENEKRLHTGDMIAVGGVLASKRILLAFSPGAEHGQYDTRKRQATSIVQSAQKK